MAGTSVGKIVVELGANVADFKSGFNEAVKTVQGFGNVVRGFQEKAGAWGFDKAKAALTALPSALSEATARVVEMSGRLSDLSARTAISTTNLQKLEFAGKLVGVSLEGATSAIGIMQRQLGNGGKEVEASFKRLGLSVSTLKNMDPAEAFSQIAAKIRDIKNPTEQAAAAMGAFGRGGIALLPLIKSDMAGAAAEAERLGLILSEKTVKAGDALGDSFDTMTMAGQGFLNNLVSVIVESQAVHDLIAAVTEIFGSMSASVHGSKGALQGLVEGGIKLLLYGVAGVMTVVTGFIDVVGMLMTGIDSWKAGILGVAEGYYRLEAAFLSFTGSKAAAQSSRDMAESLKFAREEAIKTADETAAKYQGFSAATAKAAIMATDLAANIGTGTVKLKEQAPAIQGVGTALKVTTEEMLKHAKAIDDLKKGISDVGIYDTQAEGLSHLEEVIEKLGGSANLSSLEVKRLADAAGKLGEPGREFVHGLADSTSTILGVRTGFDTLLPAVAKTAKEVKSVHVTLGDAKKATFDWSKSLEDLTNLASLLPGIFGKAAGAILGGVSGIGSALKGIGGLKGLGSSLMGKGGISGIFAGLGAAGQMAGAAIGIGKAIVGLFKSDPVKKAQKEIAAGLGMGVSKEFAEQASKLAKDLGISVTEAARKMKVDDLNLKLGDAKGRASDAGQRLMENAGAFSSIEGAGEARGRLFSQSFWLAAKTVGFAEAGKAFSEQMKAMEESGAVVPESLKNTLALFQNEGFAKAADGARGLADQFKAMAELTGVSAPMIADFGQTAQAAFNQAMNAGAGEKDALMAIMPLLAQMSAISTQTGVALDATTQGLIDQAKAAGMEIPVDSQTAMLNVLGEIRDIMAQLAGLEVKPKISPVYTPPSGVPTPGPTGGESSAGGMGAMVSAANGYGNPDYTGALGMNRTRIARSGSGGYRPKLLKRNTLIQAHEGEAALIIPRGMHKFSSAGGFGEGDDRFDRKQEEREQRREERQAEAATQEEQAQAASAAASQAAAAILSDAVASMQQATLATVASAVAAQPKIAPVTINSAPNINVDQNPVGSKQGREEVVTASLDGFLAAVRTGNSEVTSVLDTYLRTRGVNV